MRLLIGLGVVGTVLMATAPAYAAEPDQDSAQIMCDLTGDCAGPTTDANSANAPSPAAPTHGAPRTSAARGFTFQRASTSEASAAPVARPSVVRPAQVGAADLRLTFAPNSAELTDSGKARLSRLAGVLDSSRLVSRRLRIEGHTDSSGSFKANLDLSKRRAQSVADYLSTVGVARSRLDVVGYGSTRPLPGTSPSAPQNRRVMAVLL